MRPARLIALLLPLTLLLPATARADDAKAAHDRFTAGAQAYREARYKAAIELFLQANALEPHAELIFNVGQAYEKLGDVPNALRAYRDYLRKAPAATDRVTVEASIKNLEARLREKGVQQVSVFSTPAGAAVILDEKAVGQTPWTGEIAPGRHVVVLRASGFPDTAKEFVLPGDRAMDLDVALSRLGSGATTLPPAAVAKVDEPKAAGHPVKPWTYAVLGVGVAGLGAALGLELARESSEKAARNDPTQSGYADRYHAMTTQQTAARALVGVGAAATAAGAALLIVDLTSSGAKAPKQAGFGCFGATCGAFAFGSF